MRDFYGKSRKIKRLVDIIKVEFTKEELCKYLSIIGVFHSSII
ncbi:hypothetical protein [Clostridium sporogenes]|nr:hypothetical protein [Clostridium sporogenes]